MTTLIHFSGAEVAKHRHLLLSEGVESMALNLSAYFAQRQPVVLRDPYEGLPMVLYSSEGGLDANKVNAFLEANADSFSMIYGLRIDHPNYVPEWTGGNINEFYEMAEGLQRVGIAEHVATDTATMRFVTSFCRKMGIGMVTSSGRAQALLHPWNEVISSAWIASMRHKELQVWDGNTVRRYSRTAKTEAIVKHRGQLIALGCNPDDIADDVEDSDDLVKAAIRSWLIFGRRDAKIVAIHGGGEDDPDAPPEERAVAIAPRERERALLPSLRQVTVRDADDEEVSTKVATGHKLLRSCSSCNLSQLCPSFEPGAQCAFSIPVELSTKGDLKGAQGSLLEMQLQRIMMARYAEDLLSQGIDPAVSAEIERFFRMVESVKRSDQVVEQLQITATASAGVMGRLFGQAAGEANRALNSPVPSDRVIESIIDADVLDPSDDT